MQLLVFAGCLLFAAGIDCYCCRRDKRVVFLAYACCAWILGSLLVQHEQEDRPTAFFLDAHCSVQRCYPSKFGQSVRLAVEQQFQEPEHVVRRRVHVWLPHVPVLEERDQLHLRGLCIWDDTYQNWHMELGELVTHTSRHQGARSRAWQAIDTLPRHRDIASALWLGVAPQAAKRQFREAGIAHVLVVSGMHVGMVFVICAALLRFSALPWWPAQALLIGVLFYYLWLTGFAIPTQRAVLMAGIIIGANVIGRDLHRYAALSLTVIILLLLDPLSARELGFQLSVAAVAAILSLGLSLRQLRVRYLSLQPWPLDRPIWRFCLWLGRSGLDACCIGIAASLAIAPLLAAHFEVANPWSPIATVLVSPLIAIILGLGAFYIALASLWLDGPWQGFIYLSDCALSALHELTMYFANFEQSVIAVDAPAWYIVLCWPFLFLPFQDLRSLMERLLCFALLLWCW